MSLPRNLLYSMTIELTFGKFWGCGVQAAILSDPAAFVAGRLIATHCNTLQHTASQCNTLQHTASHCTTLQHTALVAGRLFATCCNMPQHTSTPCRRAELGECLPVQVHKSTLHHAAHCNTLQHTATHATHCETVDV